MNEFPTLTETFILNQIVFLIEKGIEIHIFSLYSGNFTTLHKQFREFELENRVTYITNIPKSPVQRVKEIFRFLKKQGLGKRFFNLAYLLNPFEFGVTGLKLTYLLYFSRMYALKDFDLIHAHFGNIGVFIDKFVTKRLLGNIPYIVSFHGYDLVPNQAEINKQLYHRMFLSAKMFTVNSNYTRGLLANLNPSVEPKVRFLPESLDTSLFQNLNEPADRSENSLFRMVYVGRLVAWKGADTAIKILEKIVYESGITNVELTIIGRGPLQRDLEKIIFDKRLVDYVKLLGGLDQSTIKSILGQSDLFLYTGRYEQCTGRAENQGLVLMEAQAMGLPVVAFEVGGVGEGIINGKTGILVHSEDIEAFTKEVILLIKDLPKRSLMGIAAREFVKNRYDQNVLGNQLLEIYREVLE